MPLLTTRSFLKWIAVGHVGLVVAHQALDAAPLDRAGDVVDLRDVEGAPVDAGQVPLHALAEQRAAQVEQALLAPAQALARGGELPGRAGLVVEAGPAGGVALEPALGEQRGRARFDAR